jgi:hypothetical protein
MMQSLYFSKTVPILKSVLAMTSKMVNSQFIYLLSYLQN